MNGPATETEVQDRTEQRTLYAGVRGAAVRLLNRIDRSDSYLDRVLDAELRNPEISDLDKGLLTELMHGVLRWQNKLDWVLNGFSHGNFQKSEVNIKNTLRVALYQILFLDRIPHAAAVNEAVELIKRIRGEKVGGLVNAVLRNIIRNIDGIRYPDPNEDYVQYLSVMYSHPHWMVKRWVKRFGREDTQKLLISSNERPTLSLRINRLKVQPREFLTMLEQQNIQYTGSSLVDFFLRAKSLTKIGQMELFRRGFFTIQDESAILPCLLLAPQPGERVVDLCAAPGGKTTAMAEMMQNEGEILAIDKYEVKLSFIKAACDRLGLRNVKLAALDAASLESEQADKVLLDAPCSGLGVLTKKPDIKWKRDITDIIKMSKMQRELLENAARLVKPGGVLVYSTCTIEAEENQEVVNRFLSAHPEFGTEDARQFVNHSVVNAQGAVETFPHVHGVDGSFAIRMVKKTSGSA